MLYCPVQGNLFIHSLKFEASVYLHIQHAYLPVSQSDCGLLCIKCQSIKYYFRTFLFKTYSKYVCMTHTHPIKLLYINLATVSRHFAKIIS